MSHKVRTIQLPNDDSEVVVIRGGIKVAFNAGGIVAVHTNGNTPSKAVTMAPPRPEPGDKMPDGTICAGISPDTGKLMYTTPANAPLTMEWKEAMEYAAGLKAHGHDDWRMPSNAELNVLFTNRAAIGGFNSSDGSYPVGHYWSSKREGVTLYGQQRFSDGFQGIAPWYERLSVRCVRG